MHYYRRVKLSAGLLRATRQRVAFVISHWISLPVAVWLSPVQKIQTESPSKNQCRNYWRGRQDLGAAWEIFFFTKKKKERNIKWGKKRNRTEGAIFWTDFSHATDAKRAESLIVRRLGEWRGVKSRQRTQKVGHDRDQKRGYAIFSLGSLAGKSCRTQTYCVLLIFRQSSPSPVLVCEWVSV